MKIGYVRVSKQEQNEALQRDALKDAGCEKYFSDKMTGSKFERKGLEELLTFVRSGDTVIVWKLDRLDRSLKDLVNTLRSGWIWPANMEDCPQSWKLEQTFLEKLLLIWLLSSMFCK